MLGYIIIAVVLFLLGLSFNDILSKLDTPTEMPLTEGFFITFHFWIVFLLTAPVMTTRSFSLERFSGTYETLMTSPVGDLTVVLAKFTGALAFYAVTWLPLLGYLLIVRRYSDDPATLDFRVVATTFLGILLIGSVYMSLGCFASALTRSQTVAAMVSYALGLTLFLVSLRALVALPAGWQVKFYDHIAMTQHLERFARGAIDSGVLAYYLSLTVLFLFLAWKVVESRRWR
ncbi:MAG: ABC transporter permease subunit [Verrucomicrobiota bacterium]